jgi:histone H3/H4
LLMALPSPGEEHLGRDVAQSIHYKVGQIATDTAAEEGNNTISRQAVEAITTCLINWAAGVHAKDVEAFAQHRDSSVVEVRDVKLAVRRLEAEEHLDDFLAGRH